MFYHSVYIHIEFVGCLIHHKAPHDLTLTPSRQSLAKHASAHVWPLYTACIQEYSLHYSSQPTHTSVLLLWSQSSCCMSWDNVKRIVQTKAKRKTKSEWDGNERESWRWDKCLRQHERAIKRLVMKEHLLLLLPLCVTPNISANRKIIVSLVFIDN